MWITRQSPCSIHTIPRQLRKHALRELVMTRDHQNGKVQSKNELVVVLGKRDCLAKKDEIIVNRFTNVTHIQRETTAPRECLAQT